MIHRFVHLAMCGMSQGVREFGRIQESAIGRLMMHASRIVGCISLSTCLNAREIVREWDLQDRRPVFRLP